MLLHCVTNEESAYVMMTSQISPYTIDVASHSLKFLFHVISSNAIVQCEFYLPSIKTRQNVGYILCQNTESSARILQYML